MALAFPEISPIALEIGPLAIRWYALAYVVGVLAGWRLATYWATRLRLPHQPTAQQLDDFVSWSVIGIILGGRIGYALFYQTALYWQQPLEILKIWHGGMSFHGGLAGLVLAGTIFCRRHKLSLLGLSDLVAVVAPIGIFLGRLANFINAELVGRVSDVPWAMVFPGHEGARHPSQLYQAGLEGLLLLLAINLLARNKNLWATPGRLSAIFLIFYAALRAIGESFREPDAQLGFILGHITMGQILCVPMALLGLYLWQRRSPSP